MSSQVLSTNTGTGTVALFEPDRIALEEYFDDDFYTCMSYLKEGRLVLFGIGGDGGVGMLLELVKQLPNPRAESFEGRLEVLSGKIFFGDGASLPYKGSPFDSERAEGEWVEVPPGKYHYVVSSTFDSDDYSLTCSLMSVDSFDEVNFPKSSIPQIDG